MKQIHLIKISCNHEEKAQCFSQKKIIPWKIIHLSPKTRKTTLANDH